MRQPQQNEAHNSFSVPIFLLLLALLFMLSDQLSRFSVPRSMLESGKAIDRTAVEKATLINRRAVGLFPDPVEIRVSANYQRAYSSIDSGLNKATEKLSEVPSSPKKSHASTWIQAHHKSCDPDPCPTCALGRTRALAEGRCSLGRNSDQWAKAQKAAHESIAFRAPGLDNPC